MLSTFGKRVLAVNLSVALLGGLELYGYYHLLPKIIRKNFESTPLPEKPNYSEPVLIIHEETKFVFAHRGGKTAAEAVLKDTFTNNKLIRRAVVSQIITCAALSIGYAKSRRFMFQFCVLGICTNLSQLYSIVQSPLNLWVLSKMVESGDSLVWENLNEARYAQRLGEFQDPVLNYARNFGLFGTLGVVTYCAPFLGVLVLITGKVFAVHKRLQ